MKDLGKKRNNPFVMVVVFGKANLHKAMFDTNEEVCFVLCSCEGFVLYIVVLFEGRVPLARGNKIPCFWWMCKTMEANAIAFTLPKIRVKHGVFRCVY
jgi:hypothetical protein